MLLNLFVGYSDKQTSGQSILDTKFFYSKWDGELFVISYMDKNLTIEGEYSADGKIGVVSMMGTGPFSINFGENRLLSIKVRHKNTSQQVMILTFLWVHPELFHKFQAFFTNSFSMRNRNVDNIFVHFYRNFQISIIEWYKEYECELRITQSRIATQMMNSKLLRFQRVNVRFFMNGGRELATF